MTNSQTHLSDRHNFGKTVQSLDNERIHKPRSMHWERLLLGNSDFRVALNTLNELSFSLPKLDFQIDSSWSGSVSRLEPKEITIVSPSQGFQMGCTIALFAWLGISDLHRENIKFGLIGEKFVFTTVDIETVMDEFELLSHSGMVPDHLVPMHAAGLFPVLSLVEKGGVPADTVAAICDGYLRALKSLDANRLILEQAFCSSSDCQEPIRVVLRKTRAYINYLSGQLNPGDFEIPVLPGEQIQLERGDIPYFFRLARQPLEILMLEKPYVAIRANLGGEFKNMRLNPRRGFDLKSIDQPNLSSGQLLLKAGVLQIARTFARAFNLPSWEAKFETTHLRVGGNQLFLNSVNHRFKCKLI